MCLHLWWFHFKLNLVVRIVYCCFHYSSEVNSRRSKVRCHWWPNILEKSYVLYLEFIILLQLNSSEVVTLVAKYPLTILILEILCMSCLCSSIILEACQCKNTWTGCTVASYWKDVYSNAIEMICMCSIIMLLEGCTSSFYSHLTASCRGCRITHLPGCW
jgi:hypothetical protein